MLVASLNLTQVLVVGVPAYIAAMGAAVAAIMGALNRRHLQTPSGDTIGQVVERTHDLASVNAAALALSGGPGLARSVERLNEDPNGTVHVEDPPGTATP